MSKNFSAEQYEKSYVPAHLSQWEVPKKFQQYPRRREGCTALICDENGRFLEGIKKPIFKEWSSYIGPWGKDYPKPEKFSGERLLDLGSGPTVHNVATASAYFPHIVLSEFVESNCEQLRKWVRKDPDCIDWSPFLERVAKAEKRNDVKVATKEIEERIRSSVKAVIYCDVLNDQVIAKEYAQQPYDMILTALTLETAAVDLKSYTKIVGRVNRLLRKGGKLIMIGPIKCSYWKVGNNKFHCLPVEESDIQKALEENGFGDIKWKLRELPDDDLPFDCSKLYFVSSTKL